MLGEIVETVARHPLTLLEAEPGAGKTTRVPAALLAHGFSGIWVLEPRRLAARLAARRVSEEWGEAPGATIGYKVRFEETSSASTRLWFVTEGVLTRRLLSSRELPQTQVVVLDEFHERHLETDLALALLRRLQLRQPQLRLLVMSATLPGADLAGRLNDAPLLQSPGRLFPVSIRHRPPSSQPLGEQVEAAVAVAAAETSGHMLVFLPGAAEIRQAEQACAGLARSRQTLITPLHGDLSAEEQDRAVQPSNQRKIILSTNVAESSVTIDGVSAVIDSGLARIAGVSRWSGFTRLRVERISRASAMQRAGRAGRTGPGLCIRLYTEEDFLRRPDHLAPEILRTGLEGTMLDLAHAGLAPGDLAWLDSPPGDAIARAREELVRLGALPADDAAVPRTTITARGRAMAKLGLHPRLALFLIEAGERGAGREASIVAALLSEGRSRVDEAARKRHVSDVEALLELPLSFPVKRLAEQLRRSLPAVRRTEPQAHALDQALLLAYSDRVARRRGDSLLLSSGGSARLDRSSVVESEFLLALEIEERSEWTVPLVRLASPVEPSWLLALFPSRVEASERLEWNREAERVEEVSALVYDQLVLDETRRPAPASTAAAAMLAAKALEAGVGRFVEVEAAEQFLARVRFAALHSPAIASQPDVLANALRSLCEGLRSFAELKQAANAGALLVFLQSGLPARELEEIAPQFIQLASGRRARIHYADGQPPWTASRLQDFFGMKETPKVARGAVPLVVHLLAPNQRPLQMTQDLASFWQNLYPEIRKQLSRRYPKHAWPERP